MKGYKTKQAEVQFPSSSNTSS